MFGKKFILNNVIYAPTHLSNDGILELADLDETIKPASYMYFDSIEFETTEHFIEHIKEKLKTYQILPQSKIIFQDKQFGDCIQFKTDYGSIEIRVPIRIAPANCLREFLSITSKSKGKIIVLNQVVKTLEQVILESSLIL